jgi:hypothetical protein
MKYSNIKKICSCGSVVLNKVTYYSHFLYYCYVTSHYIRVCDFHASLLGHKKGKVVPVLN